MSLRRSLFNLRPLIASGAVLFVGMMIGNVGNYAVNLVVGRSVSIADYSSYLSLVSVAAIVAMPAMALATIGAKFAATFAADRRSGALHDLRIRLLHAGWLLGGLLLLLLTLAARPLSHFLNLPSALPVVVVAISFSLNFVVVANRGILQGLQRFMALATNIAIEPVVKLGFLLALLLVGVSVSGALASFGVAFLVCYLISRRVLETVLGETSTESIDSTELWQYALPTFFALTALSFLTSVDVILVKHFFEPEEAGVFAGVATIGKMVLYVSAPLVAVMFPLIAGKVSRKERHIGVLGQTLALVSIGSLLVLGIFAAAPTRSVELLFGSRYLAAAPYLVSYGFAMVELALITLGTHYYLSIGVTRVSWLVSVGLTVELIALTMYHTTLNIVIHGLIGSFGLVLLMQLMLYGWLKRHQLATIIWSQTAQTPV